MQVRQKWQIPPADFLALGLPEVAYIKDIVTKGGTNMVTLNAANGQQLAIVPDRSQAAMIARQNGLTPLPLN